MAFVELMSRIRRRSCDTHYFWAAAENNFEEVGRTFGLDVLAKVRSDWPDAGASGGDSTPFFCVWQSLVVSLCGSVGFEKRSAFSSLAC